MKKENSNTITDIKYSMSFTTCSLLYNESIKVAELFEEMQDWKKVSQHAIETNLLQYRTESALKRTMSEIISRLKLLPAESIKILINGYPQEKKQLLWFAVCMRYPFIYEFATEVINEKYIVMQNELTQYDFDAFFNSKMNWHEELEKITDSTKYKLKQILFKMLREAEITNSENYISTVIVSPNVREIICSYNNNFLRIFPN